MKKPKLCFNHKHKINRITMNQERGKTAWKIKIYKCVMMYDERLL